jgi:hypothetical protein
MYRSPRRPRTSAAMQAGANRGGERLLMYFNRGCYRPRCRPRCKTNCRLFAEVYVSGVQLLGVWLVSFVISRDLRGIRHTKTPAKTPAFPGSCPMCVPDSFIAIRTLREGAQVIFTSQWLSSSTPTSRPCYLSLCRMISPTINSTMATVEFYKRAFGPVRGHMLVHPGCCGYMAERSQPDRIAHRLRG